MKEPLALRVRPTKISEIKGQEHLTEKHKIIYNCLKKERLMSIIFYGPPGTGKTTLATVIANELNQPFEFFNAVSGNKKDLDVIFKKAIDNNGLILIMDEVHRLNKDKQDLLLPYLENGKIVLLGATTANPLFAINPAIRSRCQLLEVKKLTNIHLKEILFSAIKNKNGLNAEYDVDDDVITYIANSSNGDVRFALNLLEVLSINAETNLITMDVVDKTIQQPNLSIDKNEDGHYNIESAFQKSIRGSDVNAALYYMAQLILADDLATIERRLIVTAYEDIGLANPAVVARCIQAIDAAKRVGFPEARIPLSVAVIDLCLSPKSKSAEIAIDKAIDAVKNITTDIPEYLKLHSLTLKSDEKYDYSRPDLWKKIQYLPDKIKEHIFYSANSTGYESMLSENQKKIGWNRTNDLKSLKIKKA